MTKCQGTFKLGFSPFSLALPFLCLPIPSSSEESVSLGTLSLPYQD